MSKTKRLPKWHFSAQSSFLTIEEEVFNQRRLNHLCKMAMKEKKRQRGVPHLVVSIFPLGTNPLQTLLKETECYALSN